MRTLRVQVYQWFSCHHQYLGTTPGRHPTYTKHAIGEVFRLILDGPYP